MAQQPSGFGNHSPYTSAFAGTERQRAWAYAVVWFTALLAFGAVWTRGVQGDDLCMCELAAMNGYWDAVGSWLDNWNGRLFLALTQIGTYSLAWFSHPLNAPWYLIHGIVVFAHMATCGLLFSLIVRSGITVGASLVATLIFAIHPVTFEPVLWLAESYGYVLGSLLAILAVWCYLEYERSGHARWLPVVFLLTLSAVLGIEQHLFVLGALAFVHLLRSRWYRPARSAWLPLLMVTCCALVFLALHFTMFSGTGERIARATAGVSDSSRPSIVWKMAWWLSLLPDASPYGGFLRWGLDTLRGHGVMTALVTLAALLAAWRVSAVHSWPDSPGAVPSNRHPWLILTGMAVLAGALLPFLFTGRYGVASRNMYIVLPGLSILIAAGLHLSAKAMRKTLRLILAPAVAVFVATSLTIDIGAQAVFARSWRFHEGVIHAVETDAASIRAAGALELIGIPAMPYKAISQIDNSWAFPCLVRWVVADNKVRAWNNLMRPAERHNEPAHAHRIVWRHD